MRLRIIPTRILLCGVSLFLASCDDPTATDHPSAHSILPVSDTVPRPMFFGVLNSNTRELSLGIFDSGQARYFELDRTLDTNLFEWELLAILDSADLTNGIGSYDAGILDTGYVVYFRARAVYRRVVSRWSGYLSFSPFASRFQESRQDESVGCEPNKSLKLTPNRARSTQ